MKTSLLKASMVAMALCFASPAFSQSSSPSGDIPRTITYQGVLTNDQGGSVHGEYPITVTFYSDPTGTHKVWEGIYNTQVVNGNFNILLGSGDAPLPTPGSMNQPLWIGTQINGISTKVLAPLSASPYALTVSNNSITSEKIVDKAITAEKIGADYLSSFSINGQEIKGQGIPLNFVAKDGMKVKWDEPSRTMIMTFDGVTRQDLNTKGKRDSNPLYIGGNDFGSNVDGGGFPNSNTVGGGQGNNANPAVGVAAGHATIAGGMNNTASGQYSSIIGGQSNNASGDNSTIGGGESNSASANHATVGGGFTNNASGSYAFIGGGLNNDVGANEGTVSGGNDNNVTAIQGTIGGGGTNNVAGVNGTIGGGLNNDVTANEGTVGGGYDNNVTGSQGTIGGGYDNNVTGQFGTVGGGATNVASGTYSTVAGGQVNEAAGTLSAIPGGFNLKVGSRSFGFNADNSGTQTDVSAQSSIAYFGDVDIWVGNYSPVGATAASVKFFEPNTSANYLGTNFSAFKAGVQANDITYTLPNTTPLVNDILAASVVGGTNVTLAWVAPGSTPFNAILSGINTTATMTVGAGASILAAGGTVQATQFLGLGSTTNAVDLATAEVAGTLPVSQGGTGATTLTGIVRGNGVAPFTTGAVNLATVDVTGTLPIVRGGTNSALPLANNRVMVSNAGQIRESAALANGQIVIGNTGLAPVVANLTAGPGIAIANGAGSITISTVGGAPLPGTLVDETLRWDGINWVPTQTIMSTASPGGTASVNGTLSVFGTTNLNGPINTPLPVGVVKSLGGLLAVSPVNLFAGSTEITGTLGIANGGTNSNTLLNNNRIMVSNAGQIRESAALANGQIVIGSTGAAPVVTNLTGGTGISIANGPGSITINSNVAPGTTANSTLYWDNTALAWTENTALLSFPSGELKSTNIVGSAGTGEKGAYNNDNIDLAWGVIPASTVATPAVVPTYASYNIVSAVWGPAGYAANECKITVAFTNPADVFTTGPTPPWALGAPQLEAVAIATIIDDCNSFDDPNALGTFIGGTPGFATVTLAGVTNCGAGPNITNLEFVVKTYGFNPTFTAMPLPFNVRVTGR